MSSSYLPTVLAESSFHRRYFSAKNFTGTVRIKLTLSLSHLPGGTWLCQLLSGKLAVASMASSFADPQKLVWKEVWAPQPSGHRVPWGCKLSVFPESLSCPACPLSSKEGFPSWVWIQVSILPPAVSWLCPFPHELCWEMKRPGCACVFSHQNIPILITFWGLRCCSSLECNKILNLEFPAGWLVNFLARSVFQNVAIFLGRKEGFGFWVTQKFIKIFLKLNMQSFEMTQLLLSKLSKQQEVLDWFQSSKTVVETCFQSTLDTRIYPHSYGNNFFV